MIMVVTMITIMINFQFANGEHGIHSDSRCCSWTFVFDPSGRLVYYWSVTMMIMMIIGGDFDSFFLVHHWSACQLSFLGQL